jgi:hypothetical protein
VGGGPSAGASNGPGGVSLGLAWQAAREMACPGGEVPGRREKLKLARTFQLKTERGPFGGRHLTIGRAVLQAVSLTKVRAGGGPGCRPQRRCRLPLLGPDGSALLAARLTAGRAEEGALAASRSA